MMIMITIINDDVHVDSVDLPPLVAQDGHSINTSPIGHTGCDFTKTFNNIYRSYPCQKYTEEYLFLIREICEGLPIVKKRIYLWQSKMWTKKYKRKS